MTAMELSYVCSHCRATHATLDAVLACQTSHGILPPVETTEREEPTVMAGEPIADPYGFKCLRAVQAWVNANGNSLKSTSITFRHTDGTITESVPGRPDPTMDGLTANSWALALALELPSDFPVRHAVIEFSLNDFEPLDDTTAAQTVAKRLDTTLEDILAAPANEKARAEAARLQWYVDNPDAVTLARQNEAARIAAFVDQQQAANEAIAAAWTIGLIGKTDAGLLDKAWEAKSTQQGVEIERLWLLNERFRAALEEIARQGCFDYNDECGGSANDMVEAAKRAICEPTIQ